MKNFKVGSIVVLNEKAQPLLEHKGWLIPGRRLEIIEMDFENKRRRTRWFRVKVLGKSGHIIGISKVPSNWLEV